MVKEKKQRTVRQKVAKLAGELAIIFLGVILALAGENYIDYLNDRASEKDYLTNLLEELEVSKSIYVGDRQRYHETDSAALTLTNIAKTGDTTNYDICELIGVANQLIEPDMYKSVYEDMRSSGNLTLITNVNLRQGIILYYQREAYEEKWAYDIKGNLSKPYDKWAVDLVTVDEYAGYVSCNHKRILTLLRQDEIINNLNRTRKMAIQNGGSLDERIDNTNRVISAINAELAKM